jgi:hypothetical protein
MRTEALIGKLVRTGIFSSCSEDSLSAFMLFYELFLSSVFEDNFL